MKVTVNGKDGDKEVVLVIKSPNNKQLTDAKIHESVVFAKAMKAGVVSRTGLNNFLKEQGLWNDEKQSDVNRIRKEISEADAQLSRGAKTLDGRVLSKDDAKELAMKMRKLRNEYYGITSVLTEYEKYTAEGQAENSSFDYLCSVCILNEDGTTHFKDLTDYQDVAHKDYVQEAASELAKITNNFDKDWFKKLPEIKFLVKYGYMNKEARLVNAKGKLVNEDGKLIDEEYRLVNDDGQLVNEYGDLVDTDGNVLNFVEFA